ncbi:MAG: efflux RND transporter periplasmic adaptor subunit [Phycisphaerales bacterium]
MQSNTPPINETQNASASSSSSDQAQKADRSLPLLSTVSILFRIGLIILILAAAFGVVRVLMATKVTPTPSDEAAQPIRVRTIAAIPQQVSRTWDGYGTARSMNDANVVAEVGGRVIERPGSIEVGQKVNVGTVLLRLDSGDYQNALDAANLAADSIQAQINGLSVESERAGNQIRLATDEIESAQRDLERTQQAIDAGAGSAGELDAKTAAVRRVQREVESLKEKLEMIPSRRAQLLAQLASQRASAATAEENLKRSVIRSPISGVIQSVSFRAGDWVGLGTPVARVVDISELEIPVQLPASSINWIRIGDSVSLWEGDPRGPATKAGIITRIAPEADSQNRTVTVFVEVEQDPGSLDILNPGRFVLGRVKSPDTRSRFVIPRRAISSGQVMLAVPQDNGKYIITTRDIRTDYSIEGAIPALDPIEDQWTVLLSGLKGNELVVVSLLDQLTEGMSVEILDTQIGDQP